MQQQMRYLGSFVKNNPETVHVKLWIQIKSLCMEEFYSLEEEENVQLNQNYRQLQDEN